MRPKSGIVVIPVDIGLRWNHPEIAEFATVLEERLGQPAVVVRPENELEAVVAQVRSLVMKGIRRILMVPLGTTDMRTSTAIAEKLIAVRGHVSDVHYHAMSPPSWTEWSAAIAAGAMESINQEGRSGGTTGVVLAASESQNPVEDADLVRMSHLISRGGTLPHVAHAFAGGLHPNIQSAIRTVADDGAKHVLVVPWLSDVQARSEIENEAERVGRVIGVTVSTLVPSLVHPLLVDQFVSKYDAGCLDNTLQMYLEFTAQCQELNSAATERGDESQRLADDARELAELDRKVNALLPPEYQGSYETVAPTSMGTAGLKYDGDGNVAWDEIWTSFCDLALAGGPPHRGSLLEAVTAEEALAEPDQYRAVVREIERGIRMVTGLPLITSRNPGWVGVICESEEMAVWLMRAIIVENVMVRREGDILYLPAGPKFTVKREVKNVITAIAKTVHYWKAHLFANRQQREQD